MSPEAQRIAIAEACGWQFKTQTKQILTHTKPINGKYVRAFKRPGDAEWTNEVLSEGISNRGFREYHDIGDWKTVFRVVPDYLSDLNAIREAVMSRKDEPGFMGRYNFQLAMACVVSGRDVRTRAEDFAIHNATTAQRAEAFIKALNLWDDSK